MTNKELNEQREQNGAGTNSAESRMKSRMTNAQAVDRWAKYIIPAVFRAEDALKKANPDWNERLAKIGQPGGEDPHKVAEEYCREIATIIVTQAADYEPDGTIPYDNDPYNVELPDSEDTTDQGATVV